MHIDPQCVPCLLKRVLFEADLTNATDKQKTNAIQAACTILATTYHPTGCSATIATHVHHAVYQALGTPDPYHDLKQRSTHEATTLAPTVEQLITTSTNRLKTSLLCAVIGNTLDFGIEGVDTTPEMLATNFQRLIHEGFGYDDTPTLTHRLASTRHLVFLTDNCGEHVFDRILCRELKHAYPKLSITLVVKGQPILSDATLQDANAMDFAGVVDTITTTEAFAVGIPLPPPPRLAHILQDADLIIAKGMANYESLSELTIGPVAYLMRTKCRPIAASLGLPVNINALKVIQSPL